MTDATTVSGLITQRATAGSRYANAVAELQASLIDLAALDRVLEAVGGTKPIRTFAVTTDELPWHLVHPEFAPRAPLSLQASVRARGETLRSNLP